MKFRFRYYIVLIGCLMFVFRHWGYAQTSHITARNMALGGGGTAYMDGYHANFINPANLLLNYDSRTNIEIGLIGGVSASAGGSLANISVYNEFFTTGRSIEGATADEALNGLFGTNNEMRSVGLNADVIPLGIRIHKKKWSYSAAFRSRALFRFEANRGFGKLLVKGLNADDFGEETPMNFMSESFLISEVSVGVARQFLDINLPVLNNDVKLFVGAAPKLLLGMNYTRFDFRSTLQVRETSPQQFQYLHDFNYKIQATGDPSDQLREFSEENQISNRDADLFDTFSPEGNDFSSFEDVGFGLDLGATIEMELQKFPIPFLGNKNGPNILRVGASITDIGSVTFGQSGTFRNDQLFDWRGVDNLDLERIENEFGDDVGEFLDFVYADSIANGVYGDFSPDEDGKVEAKLPTKFNLGAQLQLGKLGLSADVTSGIRDIGLDADNSSFALGAEYKLLNFIPLRAGLRAGGVASTVYSVGTGVDFRRFTFTLAVSSTAEDPSNGSKIGGAWSGLVFRF